MKKILFFLFLTSISFSFSQVARIVQSKYPGTNFGSGGVSINGEFHDFHMVGSLGSSQIDHVQYLVFDSLGNVLKIETIPMGAVFAFTKLTGVFLMSPNHVVLYTVNLALPANNVTHDLVEIDISTNTVVQITQLALPNVLNNTSPTIEIGGKYVSYITSENVGLQRVAIDKTNFSLIDLELVDGYLPINTPSISYMTVGFTISGANEFVSSAQSRKVYKRISSNSYTESLLTSGNFIRHQSIAVGNTNIASIRGNICTLLDLNLNIIGIDTLSNLNTNAFVSIVFKDNFFFVLDASLTLELRKYDVNFSAYSKLFQIGNSGAIGNHIIPILRIVENKLSFSNVTEGLMYSTLLENGGNTNAISSFSSKTIWYDETKPFIGLLDLGTELKAKNIAINTGQAFNICENFENVKSSGCYDKDATNRSLIFCASNLISGVNNSTLVGTTNRFLNDSYQIGPYTDSSDFNWVLQSKYSRRYYVTKFTIADHLQHLANGTPNYVPEFAIREWPGNGNLSIGQAVKLADFHDENSNGIYEPMLGDYPKIYGDECVFTIAHTSEGTPDSPKIELHSYRFLFHCDSNEVVRNTIFQKNFYIARGLDLDSVYISNFYDMDIGNAQDDYVGTNVELGLVYGYNGYLDDQTGSTSLGWGTAPPVFGIMTLQGTKQVNDGIDNGFGIAANETINGLGFGDGLVDNENWGLTSSYMFTNGASYPYTDPNNLAQYFQVAKGNNADGSPQTFQWGSTSLGVPVHHAMLGNSDPLFYSSGGVNHGNNMSEISFGHAPGDRRIIGSSGPGELHIGDTLTSLIALIFSRDTTATTIQQPVDKLFADATILKSLFLNNNVGCGESFNPLVAYLKTDELQFPNVIIYPNPTNQKFIISGLESKTEILLIDMKGTVLIQSSTTQNQLEIDLSGFADGMYFVSLKTDKGQILKKVVKN